MVENGELLGKGVENSYVTELLQASTREPRTMHTLVTLREKINII